MNPASCSSESMRGTEHLSYGRISALRGASAQSASTRAQGGTSDSSWLFGGASRPWSGCSIDPAGTGRFWRFSFKRIGWEGDAGVVVGRAERRAAGRWPKPWGGTLTLEERAEAGAQRRGIAGGRRGHGCWRRRRKAGARAGVSRRRTLEMSGNKRTKSLILAQDERWRRA